MLKDDLLDSVWPDHRRIHLTAVTLTSNRIERTFTFELADGRKLSIDASMFLSGTATQQAFLEIAYVFPDRFRWHSWREAIVAIATRAHDDDGFIALLNSYIATKYRDQLDMQVDRGVRDYLHSGQLHGCRDGDLRVFKLDKFIAWARRGNGGTKEFTEAGVISNLSEYITVHPRVKGFYNCPMEDKS